ncbi:MAG: imidazole glycerol phosphate synthase subunit HisH [Spirochaetales bacterium]|nr:imidazole glycerol phosphate synthase subunit HisH [Spirochaetales bacterium]MBR6348883.1 imidazole glycerol phosphate synthase subunit HisH [Spirochaetales bacterium]
MTAIIDYGVGNLFSLESSFAAIGEPVVVTRDEEVLKKADRLVLPGVGAFCDARQALRDSGLEDTVIALAKEGKPFLGICLGMQMLFERDYEDGVHEGLGLIPGEVRPISEVIGPGLKIPQIGWNALIFRNPSRIFKYIKEGDFVYFVHSYHAAGCSAHTTAVTDYGALLTASVEKDNVFGCQFHPEKSGDVGLSILKAFVEID